MENSCGDGYILKEVIRRYIADSLERGYTPEEIGTGLEVDICGVELEQEHVDRCREKTRPDRRRKMARKYRTLKSEPKVEEADNFDITVAVIDEDSTCMSNAEFIAGLEQKHTEGMQINYKIKPYVVRTGKNVIHKSYYGSCNSAQCLTSYMDFDTVEDALAYGAEHSPETGGYRKCKLCFGGDSFFKSKFEKAGGKTDAEYRDELWEEERQERFNKSH